jgi:hypothetical protein
MIILYYFTIIDTFFNIVLLEKSQILILNSIPITAFFIKTLIFTQANKIINVIHLGSIYIRYNILYLYYEV